MKSVILVAALSVGVVIPADAATESILADERWAAQYEGSRIAYSACNSATFLRQFECEFKNVSGVNPPETMPAASGLKRQNYCKRVSDYCHWTPRQ